MDGAAVIRIFARALAHILGALTPVPVLSLAFPPHLTEPWFCPLDTARDWFAETAVGWRYLGRVLDPADAYALARQTTAPGYRLDRCITLRAVPPGAPHTYPHAETWDVSQGNDGEVNYMIQWKE